MDLALERQAGASVRHTEVFCSLVNTLKDAGITGKPLEGLLVPLCLLLRPAVDMSMSGAYANHPVTMEIDKNETRPLEMEAENEIPSESQLFLDFQRRHIKPAPPEDKARLPRTQLTIEFRQWARRQGFDLPKDKQLWPIFDHALGTMFCNQWDGVKLRGWKHLRLSGL